MTSRGYTRVYSARFEGKGGRVPQLNFQKFNVPPLLPYGPITFNKWWERSFFKYKPSPHTLFY